MPMKLNKYVAVSKGTKQTHQRIATDAYQRLQQVGLFNGQTRTYRPTEEGGETLPPESTRVQTTVTDQLAIVRDALTKVFDATATVDFGNQVAKADVVISNGDGQTTLIEGAPTTFLLQLEKYLTDLYTIVRHAPLLDPASGWQTDATSGLYKSEKETKNRTAKRLMAKELSPATDKHPAQVESFSVDTKIGEYETVKFSGAMTRTRQRELLDRIDDVRKAVKFAREEANDTEVDEVKVGDRLFDYLFAG
jgi:hypothetical protein